MGPSMVDAVRVADLLRFFAACCAASFSLSLRFVADAAPILAGVGAAAKDDSANESTSDACTSACGYKIVCERTLLITG